MADCVTKVELYVSCRGLLNKDTLSKSDPMVALFMQDKNNTWYEFGRTDQVQNSLNPDFSKTILVDYYFEMVQKLKFVVYDVDNATKGLDDDDFLGEMECTLGQIVSNRSYTQPLSGHGQSAGTITIYAEEVKGGNEFLRLVFRATNLDNKDFLGKSDPFLEFYKIRSDGSCLVVHRTEVIKDNLNPHWQMLEISLQTLCSGDYDAPIKISCLDWDDNDPDDLIGSVEVTTRQLLSNKDTGTGMPLINPKKKQKKKKYVNSGVLYISSCEVAKHHTFLDYVMGGCQINFTVGIDFTASNGDPTSPSSLHYISPTEPNEYIKALMAVGDICQDYDTDKLFPAFGFGATIPPNFQVSHEFALNFNPANPYCQGVPGIVMAYQNCIRQVRLYGPTNVAPIIRHVTTFAAEAAQQQTASSYFVLLLLTDGVLSDMSDTKEAIVRASSLPMSIIIVGVGEADFSDMNQLDADEGRLKSGKNVAERDIVQFVPFREFKSQPPAVLAQQVLAEVPKQVQEYFSRRGLAPMPPKGPAPPSVGRL